MVTVEQFKKLSPEDSLWYVAVHDNARVVRSTLLKVGAQMEIKCEAIKNHGVNYFLTEKEAEEESERRRLLWRLQG